MKKFLSAVLAAVLCFAALCCFASCESSGENAKDPASALLAGDGTNPYIIVRPDDAAKATVNASIRFREALNERTGADFALSTDFLRAGSDQFREIDTEILVGNTNRAVSASVPDLRTGDFAVVREGTKIAIIGSDAIGEAVDYFLNTYVADGNVYIPDGTCDVHRMEYTCDSVMIGSTDLRDCAIAYPTSSDLCRETAQNLAARIKELYGYSIPTTTAISKTSSCILLKSQEIEDMMKYRVSMAANDCLVMEAGLFSSVKDCAALFLSYLESGEKTVTFAKDYKEEKETVLKDYMHIADDAYLDGLQAKADAMKEAVLSTASEYTPSGKGRIWYVSADGDDENDGRSEDTPIKTLNKVNTLPAIPGDVILFRRGDLFRGSVKVPMGVTLSAYGEGDKPTLCGSLQNYADPALWTLTDTPDVWKLKVKLDNVGLITFNHDPQELNDYNVTVGKMLIKGATLETVADLKEDLQFWSDLDTKYLYLCSKEGNPGERFESIEIAYRLNLISAPDNTVVDNLHVTLCGAHGVGIGTTKNVTVRNCVFDWLGGSILTGYNGGNVTRYGNAVQVFGGCNGYYVYNNWIYQIYDTGITHQFNSDSTERNTMKDVQYYDNLIEYCFWCIEYYNVNGSYRETRDVYIHDNFCRYAGYGWGCVGRETSAPMYSMGTCPTVSNNILTENNIFERTKGWIILHSGVAEAPEELCFRNNTYVQYYGTNFVNFGGKKYLFDAQADATILADYGEKNPQLYYIMENP